MGEVCIVGSWLQSGSASDEHDLWEALCIGRDCIGDSIRDEFHSIRKQQPGFRMASVPDVAHFDHEYFGLSESEAFTMDPQHRRALQGTVWALENAGIPLSEARSLNPAVYASVWSSAYLDNLETSEQYTATGNAPCVMCGRLSHFFDSHGPSLMVDTGCSSGLVAVHLARQAILRGETKLAIVATSNLVGIKSTLSVWKSGMLSPFGIPSAFDRDGNGFVRGDAFAVLVMADVELAKTNGWCIRGLVTDTNINSDGATPVITSPSAQAQAEICTSMLDPQGRSTIDCVFAHSTGTRVGDAAELSAIAQIFPSSLPVYSCKAVTGHPESSAGLISLISALHSMKASKIPCQPHLRLPRQELSHHTAVFVPEEKLLKKTTVSAFGFGGANAVAVIEISNLHQYSKRVSEHEWRVFLLSTKSLEAFERKRKDMAHFIQGSSAPLGDILHSNNFRGTTYDVRSSVIFTSREELVKKLEHLDTAPSKLKFSEFIFVLGSTRNLWQYRVLYEASSVFRCTFEKLCSEISNSVSTISLRAVFFFPYVHHDDQLTEDLVAIIVTVAMLEMWKSFNIRPQEIKATSNTTLLAQLVFDEVIPFQNVISLCSQQDWEQNYSTKLSQMAAADYTKMLDCSAERDTLLSMYVDNEKLVVQSRNEMERTEQLLGLLWSNGMDVKIHSTGNIIDLPAYPFAKNVFWPKTNTTAAIVTETVPVICPKIPRVGIEKAVKEVVGRFLPDAKDDDILYEQLDSLTAVEMTQTIGDAFSIEISLNLLERAPTIMDIVQYIEQNITIPEGNLQEERTSTVAGCEIGVMAIDIVASNNINCIEELWDTLLTGRIIDNPEIEGSELFDNSFFSIPEDSAEWMDPQHRLLLQSAYKAWHQAGCPDLCRADLILSISSSSDHKACILESESDSKDERIWQYTNHSIFAGRLGNILGAGGVTLTVDTTCTSVFSALEIGMGRIQNGLTEIVLVLSANLHQSSILHESMSTLTTEEVPRPFDVAAEGFWRSESAGCVIIADTRVVKKVPLMIIDKVTTKRGQSGMNPCPQTLNSLQDETVNVIECHGTATALGDRAEILAFKDTHGERLISSSKASIGHSEAASGLVQIAVACNKLKYSQTSLHPHVSLPSEHFRSAVHLMLPFIGEETPTTHTIGISSFGVSGVHSFTILKNPTQKEEAGLYPSVVVLPISGHSEKSLRKNLENLDIMLKSTSSSLYDIAKQLQSIVPMKHRAVCVISNGQSLINNMLKPLKTMTIQIPECIHVFSFINGLPDFKRHYDAFLNEVNSSSDEENSLNHKIASMASLFTILREYDVLANSETVVTSTGTLAVLLAMKLVPSVAARDIIRALKDNDQRKVRMAVKDVELTSLLLQTIVNSEGKALTTPTLIAKSITEEEKETDVNATIVVGGPTSDTRNIHSITSYKDLLEYVGSQFLIGEKVNWKVFGEEPAVISLPGYAFHEKPFKKFSGVRTINVERQKWKYLKDHELNGRVILPAATTLISFSVPSTKYRLKDIFFMDVTYLDESMKFKKKRSGNLITLMMKEKDIASAKFLEFSHISQPFKQTSFGSIITKEKIYSRLQECGYSYGPQFKTVKTLSIVNGECHAELETRDNFDVLLDGILQVLVLGHLFTVQDDNSLYIPFHIGSLTIDKEKWNKKQSMIVQYNFSSRGGTILGNFITGYHNGETIAVGDEVILKKWTANTPTIKYGRALQRQHLTKRRISEGNVKKLLEDWIKEITKEENIDENLGFMEMGLSSHHLVHLRNMLREYYPEISPTVGFDYPNVKMLSEYLHSIPSQNVRVHFAKETRNGEQLHANSDFQNDHSKAENKPNATVENSNQTSASERTSSLGVISTACRLPGGIKDIADFWDLLKTGRDPSSRIPADRIPTRDHLIFGEKYGNRVEGAQFLSESISTFDPAFFKISKSEAAAMDPQQRLVLEVVVECLDQANLLHEERTRIGVFIGLMGTEYPDAIGQQTGVMAMLGSAVSVVSGRINHWLESHGPSMTIDTACSSSIVALNEAKAALEKGSCAYAIVGGVNLILTEHGMGARANGRMLSDDGTCKAFDVRANGYGRSDGVAAILVELVKQNKEYRIVVPVIEVNHGGRGASLTSPNGKAQKMLIERLLNGQLEPKVWEAHGTGTTIGDTIEMNALGEIANDVIVSTAKSYIGHGEAVAGLNGILKIIAQSEFGYVPPLLHLHLVNPDIKQKCLRFPFIGEEISHEHKMTVLSSFGISGTNAALVATKGITKESSEVRCAKTVVIPLSAKSEKSLELLIQEWDGFLENSSHTMFDIAATAAIRRDQHSIRAAIVVNGKSRTIIKRHNKRGPIQIVVQEGHSFSHDLNHLPVYRKCWNEQLITAKDISVSFLHTIAIVEQLKHTLDVEFVPDDHFGEVVIDNISGMISTEEAQSRLQRFNSRSSSISNQNLPSVTDIASLHGFFKFIGQSYANGHGIKWDGIYSSPSNNLTLPNYAFNRSECWMGERPRVVEDQLLGIRSEDCNGVVEFRNEISALRHCELLRAPGEIIVLFLMQTAIRKVVHKDFALQFESMTGWVPKECCWTTVNVDKKNHIVYVKCGENEIARASWTHEEGDNPRQNSLRNGITTKKLSPLYVADIPSTVVAQCDQDLLIERTLVDDAMLPVLCALHFMDSGVTGKMYVFSTSPSLLPIRIHRASDGNILSFNNNGEMIVQVTSTNPMQQIPTVVKEAMDVPNTTNTSVDTYFIINEILNTVVLEEETDLMYRGFVELGMDSLAILDFTNNLNGAFPSLSLTTTELFDNPTGKELAKFIQIKLSQVEIAAEPPIKGDNAQDTQISYERNEPASTSTLDDVYTISRKNDNIHCDHELIVSCTGLQMVEKSSGVVVNVDIVKTARILVNLDDSHCVRNVYNALLDFIKSLLSNPGPFIFSVCSTSTAANAVARSFFKTAAAERYSQIQFHWNETLLRHNLVVKSSIIRSTSWLITGGLSGIGFTIAKWLVFTKKVNAVVLLSRRRPNEETRLEINKMKEVTSVYVVSADVSDVSSLREGLYGLPIGITHIVHSAGILRDAKIERQSAHFFDAVCRPKGDGLRNIENVLENHPVAHAIVMSSIASILGNIGQANYATANGILDHWASTPTSYAKTSINWGNWRDVGMAVAINDKLEKMGLKGIMENEAMTLMEHVASEKPRQIIYAKIDWERIFEVRKDLPRDIVSSSATKPEIYSTFSRSPGIGGMFVKQSKEEELRKRLVIHEDTLQELFWMNAPEKNSSFLKGRTRDELLQAKAEKAPLQLRKGKTAMLFHGQGSQYIHMACQLSACFPVFRETFEMCLAMSERYRKGSTETLLQIVTNYHHNDLLLHTSTTQPLLFAYGLASFKLWETLGFHPDYMIGHSVGELVAATASGVLTLEEAIPLVVERGEVMEELSGSGGMLAMGLAAFNDVKRHFGNVFSSAENSPTQVVIASDSVNIENIFNHLKAKSIPVAVISDRYPFHCKLMDENKLKPFKSQLDTVRFRRGNIPIARNLDGKITTDFDAEYWMQQAVSTVKFVDGVKELEKEGVNIWMDAGPLSTLGTCLRRSVTNSSIHLILNTSNGKDIDDLQVFNSMVDLQQIGFEMLWSSFIPVTENTSLRLNDVTEGKMTFQGKICFEDRRIVEDHKLNGTPIVPATYQMCSMLATTEYDSKIQGCTVLQNVVFEMPWNLENHIFLLSKAFDTATEIYLNGKDFVSRGRTVQRNSNPPTLYQHNIEATSADVERFYSALREFGLDYGEQFRQIQNVSVKKNDVSSIISPCSKKWLAMDAVLQTLAVAIWTLNPSTVYVPVSFGEVFISHALDSSLPLHSSGTVDNFNERFAHGGISAFQNGELVMQFEKITAISVSKKSGQELETNKKAKSSFELDEAPHIIGYEGTFCHDAKGNSCTWDQLKNGRTSTRRSYNNREELPHSSLMDNDIFMFDPEFFGISPAESSFIDPAQRHLLMSLQKSLENTGMTSLPPSTGVFIGASSADFSHQVVHHTALVGYYGTGTNNSALAGRIAHWIKAEGPTVVVDTACSSSFSALIGACEALRNGKCEYAVVGASNIMLSTEFSDVLEKAGMMSPSNACKVLDVSADGYHRGESVATMIIYKDSTYGGFPIRSWASGHNGTSASLSAPNGKSQERIMREASSEHFTWREGHMTGTSLGDPIEAGAISRVSEGREVWISSVKASFGHCEANAGLASLISVMSQIENDWYMPQLHFSCPNPKIHQNVNVRVVGCDGVAEDKVAVNSFGFTGMNTVIVVEKKKEVVQNDTRNVMGPFFIPLSSHTQCLLEEYIENVKQFIMESKEDIACIAAAFQKRPQRRYRAIICYDRRRRLIKKELGQREKEKSIVVEYASSEELQWLLEQLKLYFPSMKALPARNRTVMIEGIEIRFHYNPNVNDSFLAIAIDVAVAIISSSKYFSWPDQGITPCAVPGQPFNLRRFSPFIDNNEAKKESNYPTYKIVLVEKMNEQSRNICQWHQYHVGSSSCPTISESSPNIIIHWPTTTKSVNELSTWAMEVIKVWISLEDRGGGTVTIARKSGKSGLNQLSALVRSLSSESTAVCYKVVGYENDQELQCELRDNSINEVVVYCNGRRCVQRLQLTHQYCCSFKPTNILLTGGLGGIASAIVKHFKPKTAIALSRRNSIQAADNLSVLHCDCTDSDQLNSIRSHIHNVDCIFHCAGTVENSLRHNQTKEKFLHVLQVKKQGLENLMKIAPNKVKIVAMSSAAAVLGSAGQANYAFANGVMTDLAEENGVRIVHWGPWEDVGMLAGEKLSHIRRQIEDGGWEMMKSYRAVRSLDHINDEHILVMDADLEAIVRKQPHLKNFLEELVKPPLKETLSVSDLQSTEHITKNEFTVEEIIKHVSGLSEVEPDIGFMSLGVDSLMMEDIRNRINNNFGVNITTAELYDNSTLHRLQKLVEDRTPLAKVQIEDAFDIHKEEDSSNEIAIIGMSGAFSGCLSIDEFWDAIYSGKNCVWKAEKHDDDDEKLIRAGGIIEDIDKFDYSFWNLTKEDASRMDPQIRTFVEHAYRAMESSGYVKERSSLRVGVWTGAEPSEYSTGMDEPKGSLSKMYSMNQKDFVAAWTAHLLDLHGPAIGVYTACSSALLAIDHAAEFLKAGKVDLAIAGAVSLLLPENAAYEYQEGNVLSPDGQCRPFDVNAQGIVRGSAVGCFVLKRLNQAKRDGDHIHAVIKAIGTSNDGLVKASFMAPNTRGMKECMEDALNKCSEDFINSIKYIECHGTGTLVGDEMEITALQQVFIGREIAIGSVKANIGHAFAGAGLAGICKVIAILQRGEIPPQANFERFHQRFGDMKHISVHKVKKQIVSKFHVGVSSFGIGGTSAHLILGPGNHGNTGEIFNDTFHIIPLSGKTKDAVIQLAEKVAEYLQTRGNLTIAATTLQKRREHFKFRSDIIARNEEEAIEKLRGHLHIEEAKMSFGNEGIAFYFAPQGVQYPNMEKASLEVAPTFARTVRNLCSDVDDVMGESFFYELYPDDTDKSQVDVSEFAQVAVFIISQAISNQLKDWGIESDTLIGHSVGEYAAFTYSGALSSEETVKILLKRGNLVSTTEPARMVAVRGQMPVLPLGIEVSAYLSDGFHIVVGPPSNIEEFKKTLIGMNMEHRELKTAHGFHSSMMNSILQELKHEISTLSFNKPNRKILSNIDGKPLQTIDAGYCVKHMRQPIRIDKCVDSLRNDTRIKAIMQIGPAGILENLISGTSLKVINTCLSRRKAEQSTVRSQLIEAVAQLWTIGYELDFQKINPNDSFDYAFPTYPFMKTVCWNKTKETERAENRIFSVSWTPVSSIRAKEWLQGAKILLITSSSTSAIEELIRRCVLASCTVENATEDECCDILNTSSYEVVIWMMSSSYDHSSNFYFVSKLLRTIKGRTALIVVADKLEDQIVLGPLREHNLSSTTRSFYMELENSVNLFETLLSIGRNPHCDHFVISSTRIMQLSYSECVPRQKPMEIEGTILVLGGTGGIGKSLIKELSRTCADRKLKFIIASRTARSRVAKTDKLTEELERRGHSLEIFDVDLTNYGETLPFLEGIVIDYGTPNTVINAIGVAPGRDKTAEVLQSKITTTDNIIRALEETNQNITNLILMSSLSALLGIQGTADYAAANLYLDSLATNGVAVAESVLSIQWPVWKGEGMAMQSSQQISSFLDQGAITHSQGMKLFREALKHTGCVAVSRENPMLIKKEIARMLREIPDQHPEKVGANMTLKDVVRNTWKSVLAVESIEDKTSFFDVGGDSLNALQIVWAINNELQLDVKVNTLFDNPVFSTFTRALQNNECNNPDAIPIADKTQPLPLTFAQENMFMIRLMERGSHYNIVFAIELTGDLDEEAMVKSIQSVVERQHSLRTRFIQQGVEAFQLVVSPEDVTKGMHFKSMNQEEFDTIVQQELQREFCLEEVPLRIACARIEDMRIVLFSQFHILTDGWSMTVLAREISAHYSHFTSNAPLPPSIPIQIGDLAVWQRNVHSQSSLKDLIIELADRLKDKKATRIATIKRKSMVDSRNGSCCSILLPQDTVHRAEQLATEHKTTVYTVFLAAFLQLLRRWSDSEDEDSIVIGCPVSGRIRPEMNDLIGYFLNNTLVDVDVSPSEGLESLIEKVKEKVKDNRRFEQVPYHHLVAKLAETRSTREDPPFCIYFNFRHTLDFPRVKIEGVKADVKQLSMNRVFETSVTVDEIPEGVRLLVEYNPKLFLDEYMRTLLNDYADILSGQRRAPGILRGPVASYPKTNIVELIQAVSTKTPYAVALELTNGDTVTYTQLLAQSTAAAHWLRKKSEEVNGRSPQPNDIVPLCLYRNDFIVPMLGVLLCGMAYAPLDPEWPEVRKQQILMSIGAPFVVISEDLPLMTTHGTNEPLPLLAAGPEDLAYVIHTSGSTGTPKGVCVTHRNLVAFTVSSLKQCKGRVGVRNAHSVNTVFDVSLFTIFNALCSGATLVYIDSLVNMVQEAVSRNCDILFINSAIFNSITVSDIDKLVDIPYIFIGGESVQERNLLRALEHGANITQIYGPTEDTVWSTTKRCAIEPFIASNIGVLMDNEECFLLEENRDILKGHIGQLVLSGDKVARGYLHDFSTPGKFFVKNGKRCYATGDRVMLVNGELHFMGRTDKEIKIRGHRVDPVEIEAAILGSQKGIRAVSVQKIDDKLHAFIASDEFDATNDVESLHRILPSHMIPSKTHMISNLPLTAGGKIDTVKLIQLAENKQQSNFVQFEENSTEGRLHKIWAELLSKECVILPHSDFFSIGGHSLLVFQLRENIDEMFHITIDIPEFFRNSVFSSMAQLISRKKLKHAPVHNRRVISKIRGTSNGTVNVYVIHAIGGTIFPFYGLTQVIPESINLYGIEYHEDYPADTLQELGAFYATQILSHAGDCHMGVMGHSLGGLLAREVAAHIGLPSAVLLDTWHVNPKNLQLEAVREYLENAFKLLPSPEDHIARGLKLALMYRAYEAKLSAVKLHLFKARQLGKTALRGAIRSDLIEDVVWAIPFNGLETLSTHPVNVCIVEGTHDSMIKPQNLLPHRKRLANLFLRDEQALSFTYKGTTDLV